jgi:PKD repeat protein
MKSIVLVLGIVIGLAITKGSYSQTAPNFEAKDSHGQLYNLYDILDAGKYVVLDFYSVTCPYCQANVPVINSIYTTNGCNAYDVVVIGINWGDSNTEVNNFESTYGAVYPSISGGSGGNAIGDTMVPSLVFPHITLVAPDHHIIANDVYGQSAATIQTYLTGATGHPCNAGASAPVTNFLGNPTTVSEGESVSFTDESFGCDATSWSWTFEGGSPSTSTLQNPVVTYNTTGIYDVSLIATNSYGNSTKVRSNYIKVLSSNLAYTLNFESFSDFSKDLSPWTTVDVDNKNTYDNGSWSFLNEASKMAFMAFNPSATTPAITETRYLPHGGSKYGASIKVNGQNNDWLISPNILIDGNMTLEFYVKSPSSTIPLTRFTVNVSTTTNAISSFTMISSGSYVEAPYYYANVWTKMTYDLSAYSGQMVYIGFNNISNGSGSYMFMIDDIAILPATTDIKMEESDLELNVYPNPTDNYLFINTEQIIEIYSIEGQNLKHVYANKIDVSDLATGIYLIKVDNKVQKFVKN